MNIQRIDNNVNFQRAIIIKTPKPIILNSLYDYHYFNKKVNSKYEHLSIVTDKEGFWSGMLVNGEESRMNPLRVEEKAETIVIVTIDDFKKAKKIIKSMLGI